MFNHYVRILATVPRWAILPTIRRQHVADHSFYVALYVAELISKYHSTWPADIKFLALRQALIHDAPEARMSDIPGPVKRQIKDPEKFAKFEENVLTKLGFEGWDVETDVINKLIKVADLIDEFYFICIEINLGNQMMGRIQSGVRDRLHAACANAELPFQEILRDIQNELREMRDFETVANNDDVAAFIEEQTNES